MRWAPDGAWPTRGRVARSANRTPAFLVELAEALALNPCAWCHRALGGLAQHFPGRTPLQPVAHLFHRARSRPRDVFPTCSRGTPRRHRRGRAGSSNGAWRREVRGVADTRRPPLQETLRTLSGLLDDAGVQTACVVEARRRCALSLWRGAPARASPPGELRREITAAASAPASHRLRRCPRPTRLEHRTVTVDGEAQSLKLVVRPIRCAWTRGWRSAGVHCPAASALLRAAIYSHGIPDAPDAALRLTPRRNYTRQMPSASAHRRRESLR